MWSKEKDVHAEKLWNFVAMFSEFEIENHVEGCDLDEMGMHRVFDRLDKHQTMQQMRAHLQKVGVESFKRIGMISFLVFNYGYDWVEVVNALQGGNGEGIAKAKQMLEEVAKAFAEAQSTAESSKAAMAEVAKMAALDVPMRRPTRLLRSSARRRRGLRRTRWRRRLTR